MKLDSVNVAWIIRQKDNGVANMRIASSMNISVRRVQRLYSSYEVMKFLQTHGMIQVYDNKPGRFTKTALGDRISRLYITPLSVPTFMQALEKSESQPATDIGFLHLVCCMYDWNVSMNRREESAEEFVLPAADQLLVDKDADRYSDGIVPALALQERIEEAEPMSIYRKFGVGEGDLYSGPRRRSGCYTL